MARPLRLEFPGAVYHVTSPGNARQAIFLDNADREPFRGKKLLKEVPRAQRYAARPSLAEIFGEKNAKSRMQKDEVIYRACVEHGCRMVEIAEYLGVHYATISRAIKRGEKLGTRNARMYYCKT